MAIEVVSFLVGAVFVLIALLGGGIEVKELKVPTVGMGKRIAALFGGMMFIGLGLIPAAWRAAKVIVAESAQEASVAAPPNSTAVPGGPVDPGTVATALVAEDAAPAANFSDTAAAAVQSEFTGFTGSSVLTWSVAETKITGVTYMNGENGVIRITFLDAEGAEQSVDEDLQLQQADGRIWYVGSNPRYAGTSSAYPDYKPDSFEVVASSDGGWTYARVCDDGNGCQTVEVGSAG